MKTNRNSRRAAAVLMTLVLSLTMVFGTTATSFAASEGNMDVYVTVERTLLGNQDLVLEPTKVTVPDGSTVMDVLNKLKKQETGFDFTSTGSVEADTAYIKGFKVKSHAPFNYLTDYEFWNQFNAAAGESGSIYFDYGTTPSATDLYLEAGDYNMLGGWIVSANNEIRWDDESTADVNEAYPTASAVIEKGDTVLRFEYSLALARDCGYKGWSLLTMTDPASEFYKAADKTTLVRNMANNPNADSYKAAMKVLKDMTATQAEVNAAAAALK